MSDEDLPPAGASAGAGAPLDPNSPREGGANADGGSSSDDGEASAAGGPPTPHPFLRSESSNVDEKVDDWVRSSRHRMLADASVNSAPDLCRALILYKPVVPLAAPGSSGSGAESPAEDEGGGGGEGVGDPTPSPQTGGDDGGETAPSAAAAAAAGLGAIGRGGGRSSEQSAGSSTAEAAGLPGGGGRIGRLDNGYANGQHHHRVAGSLFGSSPPGLCTAQSGGDDAGGGMLMREDSEVGAGGSLAPAASVDEMDMDAGDEEGGAGASDGESSLASWNRRPPEPPTLTRAGRSRGAPTPDLTPERAAWARVRW